MQKLQLIISAFFLALLLSTGSTAATAGNTPLCLEVAFVREATVAVSSAQALEVSLPVKSHKEALSAALAQFERNGGRWQPSFPQPSANLAAMRERAEIKLGRTIARLENFVLLRVPDADSLASWAERIRSLPGVWYAEPLPEPVLPPAAPDFFADQGYLMSAPDGIDAELLWDVPGGTGATTIGDTVRVCDIEFDWNLAHSDFPSVTTIVPSGMTPWSPLADDNHGTAVLGQLASKRDSVGTTGAVYAAKFYVGPSGLDSIWQPGVAILEALTVLGEGDVLLIEHEMVGPGGKAVPIEWWPSWYAAIVTAVGAGVHVIEAAGNGGVDLDDPIYSTGNSGHWPFLPQNNSGAIIVGAGAAPSEYGGSDTARSRLPFSNFGSRVDLQGWGERVATTGFGFAYPLEGKNAWYTKTFSGTSSAAPIVAGAVASLEGVTREATDGGHVDPLLMRSILIASGTAQQAGNHPVSQHIGPLPNLPAAYNLLPLGCCEGTTGNIDCDANQEVTLTDLTVLVNQLFVLFDPFCCPDEANVNGDANGIVNLSDITLLANHLFVTFEPLPDCP